QETVLVRMLNLATNNDCDGAGRLQWQRCLLRLVTRSSAPNDRNQEEDCQWRSHSAFTQRTTQLSDGGHEARRWQQQHHGPFASVWLGGVVIASSLRFRAAAKAHQVQRHRHCDNKSQKQCETFQFPNM